MSKYRVRSALLLCCLLALADLCQAASRVKIRGYITARPDANTLMILDDSIQLSSSTHFDLQNSGAAGAKPLTLAELSFGTLIEAEGTWTGRHKFTAEKVTCDADQFDHQIHGDTVLQTEPADAIAGNQPARLKADGELLRMDGATKRNWKVEDSPHVQPVVSKEIAAPGFVGDEIKYSGVRGADGTIAVEHIELGERPPRSAYRIPGDLSINHGRDPQTKIDVLEVRKGDKLEGRMKLFDVQDVQDYVKDLGVRLLPPAADVTARALEFRFYVVEDPSINAAALPDGTVLVNTGLLGAVENESELAFVLSHEIAHVLQAHQWREKRDTQKKKIMIIIAGAAGGLFIGNLAELLAEIGCADLVNGYSRRIENQADRLGLQNIVDLGYDPRSAVTFFQTMVERYGRSSSAIWSNHDSNLLRGSFLTVQLARQYPKGQFDHAVVDTDSFKSMKEAMGPVKIM